MREYVYGGEGGQQMDFVFVAVPLLLSSFVVVVVVAGHPPLASSAASLSEVTCRGSSLLFRSCRLPKSRGRMSE